MIEAEHGPGLAGRGDQNAFNVLPTQGLAGGAGFPFIQINEPRPVKSPAVDFERRDSRVRSEQQVRDGLESIAKLLPGG
jgi:hypothetical protein